jgi:hypothetical protein
MGASDRVFPWWLNTRLNGRYWQPPPRMLEASTMLGVELDLQEEETAIHTSPHPRLSSTLLLLDMSSALETRHTAHE